MKYSIGCLFVALALFIMTMNWLCVLASTRNKRKGIDRHHSQVLLVPELLIGAGALLPLPFPKWYLLIPLALHIGTWVLPASLFYFIQQIIKSKRSNEE
jgi:ABC-type Fe3+ transport system permease subunit